MMFRSLSIFAAVLAAPVLAQQTSPPAPAPTEEGGLSGSVSDESDWQDLGIAIPSFATDADLIAMPQRLHLCEPLAVNAGAVGAAQILHRRHARHSANDCVLGTNARMLNANITSATTTDQALLRF